MELFRAIWRVIRYSIADLQLDVVVAHDVHVLGVRCVAIGPPVHTCDLVLDGRRLGRVVNLRERALDVIICRHDVVAQRLR